MQRKDLVVPAAIVVAGAAIRVAAIGQQSYSFDESYTVHIVGGTFGALLRGVARTESTPPLYYALAWVWAHLFGDGEVALRSLSALLGAALVVAAYVLGRRIGGGLAGWIGAALVAANPLLVWYSQEARAYSLAALTALFTVLAALATRRRAAAVAPYAVWAACSVAALSTHYFTIFVVLPEALWLLFGPQVTRRTAAAAAVGVVALAGLALLPLALTQRSRSAYLALGSDDLVHRAGAIPKEYLLGGSASQIDEVWVISAAALLGLGALAAVAGSLRNSKARVLAALGSLGVGLPLVLALVGADYVNPRNVLPALPVLLVGLGVAVTRRCAARRLRQVGLASVVGLVVLFLGVDVAVTRSARLQRTDWRGAARIIDADPSRPAVLLLAPAGDVAALSIYLRTLHHLPSGRIRVRVVWALAVRRPPGAVPADHPASPLRAGREIRTASLILRRYQVSDKASMTLGELTGAVFPGVSASAAIR